MLTVLFFFIGEFVIKPVVGEVIEGSAAEEVGLQVGDEIVAINEHEIKDFADVQRVVRFTDYGKPLTISILRQNQTIEVSLLPKVNEAGIPLIGVRSSNETDITPQKLTFGQSVLKSLNMLYDTTKDMLLYLGQVITAKRAPKDMRGPLGIAEASGDALRGGALTLLIFVVQISVAVGFMNLLPIPLLDGGHLFLYGIEAIRRKPLSEKQQAVVMWFGFSLLMLIFAYTMVLDVPRIIQRIVE